MIVFAYISALLFGLAFVMWLRRLGDDIYSIFHILFNYFFRNSFNRYLLVKPLNLEYKNFLNGFSYYQNLSEENKNLFEKRVQKFIDIKEFYPQGNLKEVTSEMRFYVAASAIQLTFGMPGVYLKHFSRVFLFYDSFYLEGSHGLKKGNVYKNTGKITLSWKNLKEGSVDEKDGRHVGLHEMAHALRFENLIKNEEYGYFKWFDVQNLDRIAGLEIDKISNQERTIFAQYDVPDHHEFFAVLVELFFEKSNELMKYNAQLYNLTCNLLRQDPMTPNKKYRRRKFIG